LVIDRRSCRSKISVLVAMFDRAAMSPSCRPDIAAEGASTPSWLVELFG
jgi:hypothetical protein